MTVCEDVIIKFVILYVNMKIMSKRKENEEGF